MVATSITNKRNVEIALNIAALQKIAKHVIFVKVGVIL